MKPIRLKSVFITMQPDGGAILSFSILGIPFEIKIYQRAILWMRWQSNAIIFAPLGDNVVRFPEGRK